MLTRHIARLQGLVSLVLTRTWYRLLFGSIGWRSRIIRPALLWNSEKAIVGARVLIRYGLRLEILERPDGRIARIMIGDDTNIEQNCHIICQNYVEIGHRVSIAGHCAIVDTTHPFGPGDDKIGNRIDFNDDTVIIGDGCFIGFGSILLPGTRLGRGCVVGAMSVVRGVFPDNSVIAGIPARILKSRLPQSETTNTSMAEPEEN